RDQPTPARPVAAVLWGSAPGPVAAAGTGERALCPGGVRGSSRCQDPPARDAERVSLAELPGRRGGGVIEGVGAAPLWCAVHSHREGVVAPGLAGVFDHAAVVGGLGSAQRTDAAGLREHRYRATLVLHAALRRE